MYFHRLWRTTSTSTASATACGALLLLLGACTSDGSERVFVERLGTDTMSIETYTRSADQFEGRLVMRSPVTRVAEYTAQLSPEGTVTQFDLDWSTPAENPNGPQPESYSISFEGEQATVIHSRGEEVDTMMVDAAAGTVPLVGKIPMSFAVMEQAVVQAVAAGSDNFPVNLLNPGRSGTSMNAVVREDPETISMDFFGSPILASVSTTGEMMARSGARTTMKAEGELVAEVDFDALAAEFAARDARGEGMGIASPPATVQANVGGSTIQIDYSQPAKRGRAIWGGLVPTGEVWRTGANAATVFSTSRDLVMRGQRVPAGSYSLWSTYTADGVMLIINEQTGQWGTAHDPEQDFLSLPMDSARLSETVERFTIEVEETEDGGVLRMSWDLRTYSMPFTVR